LLRAVYAAGGPDAARAALDRCYRWSDGVGVAELSRLARTVRVWEAEILAWHATGGCSNGPTEAVNLLIKKVKRVGRGFRNVANYRLLLHCGVTWQTHPDHKTPRPLPTPGGVVHLDTAWATSKACEPVQTMPAEAARTGEGAAAV
jgi:transposase